MMGIEAPVLVLAAHPDDEVLGCGGTIARLRADGVVVQIAILGEGATSRFAERDDADDHFVATLKNDARRAGGILGVDDVRLLGLPDNRFDTVPLLDIIKHIEAVISEVKPVTVFTQHGGDLNVDHQRLFQATLTACRPVQGNSVRALFAYEVASSTEWAFGAFEPRFTPDLFVDIGEHLETKIEAMQCYGNERRDPPHPRAPDSLRSQAARWGAGVGCSAAEAFQTVFHLV